MTDESLPNDITELIRVLEAEMEQERAHLISIAGPTGMRNSQASAMGLERNSVRTDVVNRIKVICRKHPDLFEFEVSK